jgi:fimbrial isopeptide formation D2 family protein/LPXTG-motif cell wall-anchored protein
MKKLNKVLVVLLSAIMVLAMSASAFAADPTDGKITVTPPEGTISTASNTYTLYKVFSATSSGSNYNYTLSGNHTTVPDGFILDDAGNVYFAEEVTEAGEGTFKVKVGGAEKILKNKTALSQNDIDAIAAYVTDDDIVGEPITVAGRNAAVFDNLAYGYYFVSTTTGTLVVIDSTRPDVTVDDKNTVPSVDKKATGEVIMDEDGSAAIAQVGTDVNFEATVTIGKGATNYVFHDKMDAGLSYNDDVKVYNGDDLVAATNYSTTPATGDTLTVAFKDDYITELPVGTELVVKYSAKVTSDALQVNPAKNTATISYGDSTGTNSTPGSSVEVYNAKITVDKKDGNNTALAGAGFVLKKGNQYYKKADDGTVSWVATEGEATELTTKVVDGKAEVEFTGLGAGTYTLHEKTVPEGYNPAADSTITVTTDDKTTANLAQTAEVVNNAGAELPSTGGIGTTIFYVLGSLLVVGCGIVLVSRKRMQNNK